MNKTSRFIGPLLEFLFPSSPESTLVIYHAYIRKSAHLVEYAVLGFFASRAFSYSSKIFFSKHWYWIAFLFVLLVASIDEVNQSFNPTRTGSIFDVLLDCLGGAVMISLLMIYKTMRND